MPKCSLLCLDCQHCRLSSLDTLPTAKVFNLFLPLHSPSWTFVLFLTHQVLPRYAESEVRRFSPSQSLERESDIDS